MSSKHKLILWISTAFLFCLAGLYFALQAWVPFMWFLSVFGVGGIAYVIFRERKLLADFLQMKTTKHGLSMGSVLLVTLAFLVLINYFSVKFVHVFDLSMTQVYTLSEQSKKIIDHLDSPLEVRFFYKEGLQNTDLTRRNFSNLVKVFETYSTNIKISYVEMNSSPAITELFGATRGLGEAFVSYKGKMNRIEAQDLGQNGLMYTEQDFVNAIIKTTRDKFKNIYFIEGHGERSIENDKDENAVSLFRRALEQNSYKVQSLNLFQSGLVPADADLLIIAGATQSFQKSEMTVIQSYLAQGRPLLVFLSPGAKTSGVSGPLDILSHLGWQVNSRYVFNILNTPTGPMVSTDQPTVANVFSEDSEITKYFGSQKSILFFRPNSLEEKPSSKNQTTMFADVLVRTSEQAVGIDSINTTDYSGVPESFDLVVHFAGKYSKSENTEIIFASDVGMISNMFFNQANNKELILNSVSYLAKETDLIAIPPKEPSASRLKVVGPEFNTYFKFMIVGLFLPLPLILLGLGVALWFRRRHA